MSPYVFPLARKIRTRLPADQWQRREVPELRIVDEDLWHAARARVETTAASFLRRPNGKLWGHAENFIGKYLLSGHLACGVCGGPLIAMRRGRRQEQQYACSAHRLRGNTVCTNATGVPMEALHAGIIRALHETFTIEKLEKHRRRLAADDTARASRAAERATIEAPPAAHQEDRESDDGDRGRRIDRRAARAAQGPHRRARGRGVRIAELDAAERELCDDEEALDRLRAVLPDWHAALDRDPWLRARHSARR